MHDSAAPVTPAWMLLGVGLCALLVAGTADAWPEQCKFEAERTLTLDVTAIQTLEIVGRGGDLDVRSGAPATVSATGRACASSAALLERTQIRTTREGNNARVFVQIPDEPGDLDDGGYATLDLTVQVPATASRCGKLAGACLMRIVSMRSGSYARISLTIVSASPSLPCGL